MARERLSMTKTREILRLKIGEKRSLRGVGKSVNCSPSKVHGIEARFKELGLSWPLVASMKDDALEALIYPAIARECGNDKVMPDLAYIHTELKRKGVSLHLLWQEYKEVHRGNGYQYSRFCDLYRDYRKKLDPEMRHSHKAGEKAFVDWSGDGIKITNRDTGEVWEAPLFVGTLGASGYTFATAKADRTSRNWMACHCEMYEYFGGVPEVTVPDNEKTGVKSPCLYEPDLNRTYHHMSLHYNTAIVPARPYKPKDKALVENAVLNAQRWILAALRNHTFFDLFQANAAIAEKLVEYNKREMQLLKISRVELFEQLDKPVLKPLPATRYQFAEWSEPKVHIDYHVQVDKHFYSVPFQYIGEYVSVSRTASTIEIFYKEQRIAVHKRRYNSKEPSTQKEHMPSHHKQYSEWSPERFCSWAAKTGPCVRQVVENNLNGRRHPEQAYRTCLGIMNLGKRFGNKRLEDACKRALFIQSTSYRSVHSILEKKLDQQPLPSLDVRQQSMMPQHGNIRGPQAYH